MIKKIVSLAIITIIIILGVLHKDTFLSIVEAGGTLSIFVSILLVSICVFFPIVPFPVLAGGIGAVFGLVYGIVISLTGAMLGTFIMFLLIRYGFRESAQRKLTQYPKAKDYEAFFERNSFMAILLSRVIPIIPSPLVNIICGLSKVSVLTFLAASTIGKLPNIIILSFAGANLGENKWFSISIYGSYVLILVIINTIIIYKRMAKSNLENNTKPIG